MIGSTRSLRVFAWGRPVDMRKGFEALGLVVRRELGEDLLSGDLFLFVGRTRRRAKVLYFDGTGLCLFSKRLETGRFAAPWQDAEPGGLELTMTELGLLLEGCELVGKIALSPSAVCEKALAPAIYV